MNDAEDLALGPIEVDLSAAVHLATDGAVEVSVAYLGRAEHWRNLVWRVVEPNHTRLLWL